MSESSQSLRVARLFESYVQFIWPLHRLFVKSRLSQRCLKCIASSKMIRLGADGVCEVCAAQSAEQAPEVSVASAVAEKQLAQILSQTTQTAGLNDRQYDALALFSGGKDSCYLIRRLMTDYPDLKILAFTIDNSFMSPIAKTNIDEMIGKLDVDHVFVKPKKSLYQKLFSYCLTHLNADGGYGTLDFSDGELMLDTARRFAAEKKIPLILCGYSKYQVQNGLKLNHFETPRSLELASRHATAGLKLNDIFSEDELTYWWNGQLWPEQNVARVLFPLYVWDLEESFIKDQVVTWGLVPKTSSSPIVTNHRLIPLIGVVDVHSLGYSSFEIEFCRMIREGKANKSDWLGVFEFLEYTAKSGLFVKALVCQLLSELNLTLDDVGVSFK